jgi:hypothetical protein
VHEMNSVWTEDELVITFIMDLAQVELSVGSMQPIYGNLCSWRGGHDFTFHLVCGRSHDDDFIIY